MRKSLLPLVPTFAEMLMGDSWAGWCWPYRAHDGSERWALVYREQGSNGGEFKYFKSKEALEQFVDFLDIPF